MKFWNKHVLIMMSLDINMIKLCMKKLKKNLLLQLSKFYSFPLMPNSKLLDNKPLKNLIKISENLVPKMKLMNVSPNKQQPYKTKLLKTLEWDLETLWILTVGGIYKFICIRKNYNNSSQVLLRMLERKK